MSDTFDVKKIEKIIHYGFKNKELLKTAFTHSSFNADAKTKHHDYERLEFLGDSVIGLVVTEIAYKNRPEFSQGPLTKLKMLIHN